MLVASFASVGLGLFMLLSLALSSIGLLASIILSAFFADRVSIAGLLGTMAFLVASISVVAISRLLDLPQDQMATALLASIVLAFVGWIALIWATILQRRKSLD